MKALNYILLALLLIAFLSCQSPSDKETNMIRTQLEKATLDFHDRNHAWPANKDELRDFIVQNEYFIPLEALDSVRVSFPPDGTCQLTYMNKEMTDGFFIWLSE